MTTLVMSAVAAVLALGCSDGTDVEEPDDQDFPPQVRVQVAFDASNVAFRYAWLSQPKLYPAGTAVATKVYPGQFHDLLVHDGTRFNQFPSAQRIQEDRVSFMLASPDDGFAGRVAKEGCWSTCHSGMASHNRKSAGVLDHWHWRGGRTGPMGYAEDAGVGPTERIRDAQGTPPSAFTRSAGDRIREDQAALASTGHPLAEGMPRFVFNKGKKLGAYTVPRYFLANAAGAVITDPFTELPQLNTLDANRSLLVGFQDRGADPVDKVNAIDVGYLVYVAKGTVAHLPSHLRATTAAAFTHWAGFWAAELGIPTTGAAAAEALLTAIDAEWVGSGRKAMVTRSIGFIYASSQHDVTSAWAFDAAKGEWTVTLYRKLSTGQAEDVDLSRLKVGVNFPMGFAMHDAGGGSETHYGSLPYFVGTTGSADIVALSVADVRAANWTVVPAMEVRWVTPDNLWTLDRLKDGTQHAGADMVGVTRCQSCHGVHVERID